MKPPVATESRRIVSRGSRQGNVRGQIFSTLRDDSDMTQILAEFVGDLPDRLETIRQAAANNQWDELQRLAHQLKGAGGSARASTTREIDPNTAPATP